MMRRAALERAKNILLNRRTCATSPQQKARRKNEQQEYLENEIFQQDNLKINWDSIMAKILSLKGNMNSKNFNAVFIKYLMSKNKIHLVDSFIDNALKNKVCLNLGTMNVILSYYGTIGKTQKLSTEIKEFIKKECSKIDQTYKSLDYVTQENILAALSTIGETEKCLNLLKNISNRDVPSTTAYNNVISSLFKKGKKNSALEIYNQCISNGRFITDETYLAWIQFIKSYEKSASLKELNLMFDYLSRNDNPISNYLASRLKEELSGLVDGRVVNINSLGECEYCKNKLKRLKLTNEEFDCLNSIFKDQVLVGKNIFLKTSPIELEKFLTQLQKEWPYDIVIDSLNIAFCIGKVSNAEKSQFLVNVIKHFKQRDMRVFLLGRKHMMGWPKRNLDYLLKNTKYFFTEDLSKDDPFFLTAALSGGPNTDFITRDKLRGHRFLLEDINHRSLFLRWQWEHQWSLYTKYKRTPIIQPPVPFTPCAQVSKDHTWHIPFTAENNMKDPLNIQMAVNWLCFSRNK